NMREIRVFAADQIEPVDLSVFSTEGESVTLKCSYSSGSENVVLYWYRQYPNRAPQYLLRRGARAYGDGQAADGRFELRTSSSSTDLTVREVRLADTALYYCALRVAAQ
uniref:Ig-like domain-containing protein n=1 Tax=Astyanax mexicanus TaxID=7994 RepID=A0A3B1ISE0_ASTMX